MSTCTKEQKLEIIRKDRAIEKDNILKVLLDLQYASEDGCIDEETAMLVANEMGMSQTRVFEIVSFYAMLKSKPQAKFVLKICNSSPCHFSGADKIAAILEKKLGVPLAKDTPDGLFSYHYIPCAGACDIGPIIKIKDSVFGNLNEEKINQLVDDLRAEKITI